VTKPAVVDLPYTVEAVSTNVHVIRFDGITAGWEQYALLTADRHHDNLHARWDLERAHLELARARRAPILDFGDLFCAMQGRYDPRKSLKDVRPEDNGDDYIDRLVKHASDFYGPYARQFVVIGKGNHESAILKNNGVDLTSNLVHRLNTDHGGHVFAGGYGGWVLFHFRLWGTQRETKRLKYHHGSGGGGPVTRGVIDTNRQSVYLPDADVVVNGHTHDQYYVPIARERLTGKGVVSRDLVHYIRTGTYKDEYGDGSGGYHIEKGRGPKPLGATWLRFFQRPADGTVSRSNTIGVEVILDNR
jgi:hypothetical protein